MTKNNKANLKDHAMNMRIGVLMGGRSCEAEVSFASGRTVCDHIDTSRYDVVPLFCTREGTLYQLPYRFLHRGKISDFLERLESEYTPLAWDHLSTLVDFVYIAFHGRYGEDGCVQGMLRVLDIPFSASNLWASAIGMDKWRQKLILAKAGINVPRGMLVRADEIYNLLVNQHNNSFLQAHTPVIPGKDPGSRLQSLTSADALTSEDILRSPGSPFKAGDDKTKSNQSEHEADNPVITKIKSWMNQQNISFPLVCKPRSEGSSIGVGVAHTGEELKDVLMKAACVNVDNQQGKLNDVVVEEYIGGMEFSSIVLEDENGTFSALATTEIERPADSAIFDYVHKYMPGRAIKHTPARCSDENKLRIEEVAARVAKTLGFSSIGRIDGFLSPDNTIYIIDPNTLSGMTPSSFVYLQAAQKGMNPTQLINYLVNHDMRRHKLGYYRGEEVNMKSTHTPSARLRVGVIFGGASAEREISLESGRNVCFKLSPSKYEVIPLFMAPSKKLFRLTIKELMLNATAEIVEATHNQTPILWNDLPKHIDFAFLGLHGGVGEDGSVQGMLEFLGLPYNGSGVATSAMGMDKFLTNEFLEKEGFDVPGRWFIDIAEATKLLTDGTSQKALTERGLRYPLIIKPHNDGCSVLVSKVTSDNAALESVRAIGQTGRTHALLEEFIVGTELTVGVLGNSNSGKDVQVLVPSETVRTADILSIEEKFLIGGGENQTPARIGANETALVQKVIHDAYIALDCKGYARIDCFYQTAEESGLGRARCVIIEINTLPGLTPATCIFHQAAEAGMSPMVFLDQIITLGLELHQGVRVESAAQKAQVEL